MKSLLQASVLAGGIALSLPALAHDSKAHAADPPASAISEQARPAVAVAEQFSRALQAADFDRVRALLADDVLILESGGAERSREEYLGHHAFADAAFLKDAHIQVMRRTARVEGPLAWIGTESELHATRDGKALTLLSTETMILKNTGAGWRIVHIHWSSRPKRDDKATAPAPSPVPRPTAASSGTAPPWMSTDERAVLEDAQGAGMAKAAEAHGWPGPRHVLDLGDELKLDAVQRNRMQELMAAMQASARALGARVIAAEMALDAELAKPAPDAARIGALSEEVGALRGRLRSVHLQTHLQAAELLTPAQRHHYLQLRGAAHQHGRAAS